MYTPLHQIDFGAPSVIPDIIMLALSGCFLQLMQLWEFVEAMQNIGTR